MSPTSPSSDTARQRLLDSGRLSLKVTPRARTEGVEGMNDTGELVVKVRAVPEDGRANDAVIALLAKAFDLPKSSLSIAKGSTGRHKIVAYRG